MPSATAFQKYLAEQLQPGERVEYVTAGVLGSLDGQGEAKAAGKDAATSVAKSVAATVASSLIMPGSGAVVANRMPAVWVIITDRRLLMFGKRGDRGPRAIGGMVLAGPRNLIAAKTKTGLLSNSVTFRDAETGESLLRLRTGARRGAVVKVAAACTGR